MPTYEYECKKCKKTFEISQSMKDSALKICPQSVCRQKKWGKGAVKRLLGSGAGLIFKGSGFYITDYRSEGYKQSAKKDSEHSKPIVKESSTTPSPLTKKESPTKKENSSSKTSKS